MVSHATLFRVAALSSQLPRRLPHVRRRAAFRRPERRRGGRSGERVPLSRRRVTLAETTMSYCRKKALLLLAVFCTLFTFRAPPPLTPPLLRQLLALPLRALLPMPPLAATARKKLVKSSEKRRRRRTACLPRRRRRRRRRGQRRSALRASRRAGAAAVHAVIARAPLARCKAHGVQKHKRHACILGSTEEGVGSEVQFPPPRIWTAKEPQNSDSKGV